MSRLRRFLASPERFGFALYLLVLAGAFASLGRGLKAYPLVALALLAAVAGALVPSRAVPATGRARLGHWLPAIVPGLVAWVIDLQPRVVEILMPEPQRRYHASVLALGVSIVAGAVILAGVDVRKAVHRTVRAVTSAISTVVAVVLYVVVLLPVGISHLWRAADPLRTGAGAGGTAWHDAVPQPERLATRTYRAEPSGSPDDPDRPFVLVCRVIGAVVLLLFADLAIGAAWNQLDHAPAPPGESGSTALGGQAASATIDGRALDVAPQDLDAASARTVPDDPREGASALASAPWRHEYFQALGRMPTTYWPYVLWRPLPVTSEHINVSNDWERSSYRAPDAGDAPDVDLYGGNAAFGEGQRDEHTIASELARLAEADGIPIRVHNRGVPGWVNWQGMLLFEERSSNPDTRPDIALFYDGANELEAQSGLVRGVPNHTAFEGVAAAAVGGAGADASPAPAEDTGFWGDLRRLAGDYPNWSAAFRAGRWARSAVSGDPAGAEPALAAAPAQDPDPGPPDPETAHVVYGQGQQLIEDIAERDGVDVLCYWQPMREGGWAGYRDGVEGPTIDLSGALDASGDVFIDDANVNEQGAADAAAAIWTTLEPRVRAWYADR